LLSAVLLCLCQQYDEKNIRRRVYDALNVLMAMDIISKEKKEIKWKGLPPSTGSHDMLQVRGLFPILREHTHEHLLVSTC